jgi:hypothetical protein
VNLTDKIRATVRPHDPAADMIVRASVAAVLAGLAANLCTAPGRGEPRRLVPREPTSSLPRRTS